MSKLTHRQTHGIESALRTAGAVLPCPRCGHSELRLLDGYIVEHVQSQLRNLVISGDNRLSCVATVCDRCGYLAQHAVDALGSDA